MRKLAAIAVGLVCLAGCSAPVVPNSAPEADLAVLSDVTLAEDSPRLEARAAPEPEGGFLSGLFKRRAQIVEPLPETAEVAPLEDGPPETAGTEVPETAGTEPDDTKTASTETDTADDAATGTVTRVEEVGVTQTAPKRERRGLLGFLARSPNRAPTPAPTPAPVPEAQTVALEVPEAVQRDDKPARKGLFGGGRGAKPTADAVTHMVGSLGQPVPYGQIARLCNVPSRSLGKEAARYPEKGRAVYRIYDSAPGSTGLRNMYVTGFKDGCARQFSAALAMFGDFEFHEQLRYGLPAKTIPYSETDDAYEALKSRECRVRKGKPCGNRLRQLSRTGVFVSMYERFEGSQNWKNILLHDGAVLALDVKGR